MKTLALILLAVGAPWLAFAWKHWGGTVFAVSEIDGHIIMIVLAGIGAGFLALAGVVKMLWVMHEKCIKETAALNKQIEHLEDRLRRLEEKVE